MLLKAGYSLVLISPPSAGFNSSIFPTLHQLLKPHSPSCPWLHLIFMLPPALCHLEQHQGRGEWGSAAGLLGCWEAAIWQGEGQPLLPWISMSFASSIWLYVRSLPHFTYFFLYSFSKAEGSLEHSPVLVVPLSAKLHHSTL